MYNSLGKTAAINLQDLVVNIVYLTFRVVSDTVQAKWDFVTPLLRLVNTIKLVAPWNTQEGLLALFCQTLDVQEYEMLAGVPIQENMVVDQTLICINRLRAHHITLFCYVVSKRDSRYHIVLVVSTWW